MAPELQSSIVWQNRRRRPRNPRQGLRKQAAARPQRGKMPNRRSSGLAQLRSVVTAAVGMVTFSSQSAPLLTAGIAPVSYPIPWARWDHPAASPALPLRRPRCPAPAFGRASLPGNAGILRRREKGRWAFGATSLSSFASAAALRLLLRQRSALANTAALPFRPPSHHMTSSSRRRCRAS